MLIQELIEYSHEAGIFYIRKPGEDNASIFSVTLKDFPEVVGDGKRTLRELIVSNERMELFKEVYFSRHEAYLDTVLKKDEHFALVFAGNHCQGAIFRDGREQITDALKERICEIGDTIPGFFFGRFDLRFDSLDKVMQGEGFKVVEINGASAEATHIWDPRCQLIDAYKTLFKQFRLVFEIGAANREQGHAPLSFSQTIKDIRHYWRLSRLYPPTH